MPKQLCRLGAILLIAGAALFDARPAAALRTEHTLFYSDATYTVLVGEEINNPCTGEVWYWGQITNYYKEKNTYCGPNEPH